MYTFCICIYSSLFVCSIILICVYTKYLVKSMVTYGNVICECMSYIQLVVGLFRFRLVMTTVLPTYGLLGSEILEFFRPLLFRWLGSQYKASLVICFFQDYSVDLPVASARKNPGFRRQPKKALFPEEHSSQEPSRYKGQGRTGTSRDRDPDPQEREGLHAHEPQPGRGLFCIVASVSKGIACPCRKTKS